jgi:hypothetical protein
MRAWGHETEPPVPPKGALEIRADMHPIKDTGYNMFYPHISLPEGLNIFHLNLVVRVFCTLRGLNFDLCQFTV